MRFKILNNIVDISIDPTVLVPNTLPTRGHNRRFHQLPVRINSFDKSFFLDSIKSGTNSLPLLQTAMILKHLNCNCIIIFITS